MVCCHIFKDLKEMALALSLQGMCDSEIHEVINSVNNALGSSETHIMQLVPIGAVPNEVVPSGQPQMLI